MTTIWHGIVPGLLDYAEPLMQISLYSTALLLILFATGCKYYDVDRTKEQCSQTRAL